ncbi:MAG: FecR domain-containing protein [Bacteroidales bacterium]|nr:FecR domain-containing protein [Bacteroidales bacterium]MBN2763738.1 FecR domain-containing protein [Bacteroidales bacterium]
MNFNRLIRYFDVSTSKEDKEKYQQWINKDPSRKAEVEKLRMLWNEAEQLQPFDAVDTESDWAVLRQRISSSYKIRHNKIPLRQYIYRIAAILILAFGLSFGLIKIFRTVSQHPLVYKTFESYGRVKTVNLPDNSVVVLNTHSSIRYDHTFNHSSRNIILQGEAYFEAEPNPALPFRVYTGNSVVEVKGTRFSIFEDSAYIRVLVLLGSVSFQSSEDPAVGTILSEDESGFIFRDNTLEKRHEVNINNISWKTGQLVFHKTPVKTALQDIAHHFHKELSIHTELKDSLTAQFTEQSLEDILEELRLLTSLSINHTDDIIVVKE